MGAFHNRSFHNIVRVQAIICLCMTMFFVISTFNVNTYAETTNLDIQYNYLGAMDNNKYDLNTGYPSANIVTSSINMNDVEDYYTLVLSAIQIGLGQLDKYFDFTVNVTNFNYDTWYTCLQSYSFITGEVNPSDRGEWLNAYIGIDSNNDGYVFLQYCPRVDSLDVYPVYDSTFANGSFYYPLYANDSNVTFTFLNTNDNSQGILVSSGLDGTSNISSNKLYVVSQSSNTFVPSLFGEIYHLFTPNITNKKVSIYHPDIYYQQFFYPDNVNYVNVLEDHICYKYILPLHIDSTIYLFDNNKIVTSGGDLGLPSTGGYNNKVYQTLGVLNPYIINSVNYILYAPKQLYPRIEKGYGIIDNPLYTPTPIPTFAPIYTPTPFPTNIFNPTVTPINLPLNPIIQIGDYGKPWDFISGIIPLLHSALNSGTVHLFVQTIEYIYNTSLFFEIILFLIPSICLLAFILGRLKRK